MPSAIISIRLTIHDATGLIPHRLGEGRQIPNFPGSGCGAPMKNSTALIAHARRMAKTKPPVPVTLDLIGSHMSAVVNLLVNPQPDLLTACGVSEVYIPRNGKFRFQRGWGVCL